MSFQKRMFVSLTRASPFREIGAKCYVAGKTKSEAAQCLMVLRNQGINIILDLLGETAKDEKSARRAASEYSEYMEWAVEHGFQAISLKLSKLGIEFDHELAGELLIDLLPRAIRLEIFPEVDAEYPHILSKTYTLLNNIARKLFCGNTLPAPFRAVFSANQGCICEARSRGRRCEIIGPEYCSDRYLAQLCFQKIPIRIVKGAYPGDVPSDRISDRFISLSKRSSFVAGATHDMRLFLRSLPYIMEAQMLFGIRMGLQMEINKAIREEKLKEWVFRFIEKQCRSKEIEQVLGWACTHTPELVQVLKGERHLVVKKFSCYAPIGSDSAAYLKRRLEEGVRSNVFSMLLRNAPEALWWRMRYAPSTLFHYNRP